MKTQSTHERFKRRRAAGSTFTQLIDDHIEDCVILADMRERVRTFGSTPMRFV